MSESISGGDMAGARGAGMVTLPAYLLEDSPRLAKRLDDLQAAEARAKEAVALVGPANEIAQLRAQAAAERDDQDRLGVQARKDCAELIANAEAQAADIVDRARETGEGLIESAERHAAAATEAAAEAQKIIQESVQRTGELEQQEAAQAKERGSLNQLQLDLHEREQLLLDEKSTLATVRERITEILG